jgi:hypothetical protein
MLFLLNEAANMTKLAQLSTSLTDWIPARSGPRHARMWAVMGVVKAASRRGELRIRFGVGTSGRQLDRT